LLRAFGAAVTASDVGSLEHAEQTERDNAYTCPHEEQTFPTNGMFNPNNEIEVMDCFSATDVLA
jgi:hypothetical protein